MLRLLRAFFVFRKLMPKGNPPDWTMADQKGLDAFMGTLTGRRLLAAINAQCGTLNQQAVYAQGAAFEAGTAFGFGSAAAFLITLSSAQNGESPTPDEVEESLEHLTP